MMLRISVVLCCLARFAASQPPACAAVESERILGQDLAAALPVFRALPPTIILGTMPPPGSKRTFHVSELKSLAQRYSIVWDSPADICFEWPMETLDQDRILQAMRGSLRNPEAHIEVSETSPNPVPRGRLEFPREMLGQPASTAQRDPVLWRGVIMYGQNSRYAVWAKVRLTVACSQVVALQTLKSGERIDPQQVRIGRGECFPYPDGFPQQSPEALLGMVPVRDIPARSEVRPELLTPPYDVFPGDAVQVDVRSGAAHLAFTAKAESRGRSGDWIAVRNLSSNKTFRARVVGKDQVLVQTEFAAGVP